MNKKCVMFQKIKKLQIISASFGLKKEPTSFFEKIAGVVDDLLYDRESLIIDNQERINELIKRLHASIKLLEKEEIMNGSFINDIKCIQDAIMQQYQVLY